PAVLFSSLFTAALFFTPFFYTPPPPSEIYTLSLHDALPISYGQRADQGRNDKVRPVVSPAACSSHASVSSRYPVAPAPRKILENTSAGTEGHPADMARGATSHYVSPPFRPEGLGRALA